MINLEAVVLQEMMQWVGDLGVKDINKGARASIYIKKALKGQYNSQFGGSSTPRSDSQSLSKCSIT